MVIGTARNWGNAPTVALSVVLAFVFGYALTIRPLRGAGLPLARAVRLAVASDTLSISVMEVVDNAIMLAVPGAMDAKLTQLLFWGSLAVSLLIAGLLAYPVNRWLIMRGRGHALVHEVQGAGASSPRHSHRGHD